MSEEEELKEPKDLKGRTEVTSPEKIRQLREIVQPKGRKGTWMKKLNNRQLAEVYHRLRMGQSAHKIALICQNEWKMMRKSTTDSTARAIVAFRKQALPELRNWSRRKTPKQQEQSKQWQVRAKKLRKRFNALEALAWLAVVQVERVDDLRKLEIKTGEPIRHTNSAAKELRETLESYLNMQIKLGVLESKPEELSLLVKHKFDGLLAVIKEGTGGSQAMLNATRQLVEGLEKDAVTLKLGEDGSYSLEDEDAGPESGEVGQSDPASRTDSQSE